MTERINTTQASLSSGIFSPAGDFSVQLKAPAGSKAKIDVMGRVDAAADWVRLGKINLRDLPPIKRYAKCPFVRLDMSGNDSAATIIVWSGE